MTPLSAKKLSRIIAPPTVAYSRREWSEAKLRRMQKDLIAGNFPETDSAPGIDVQEEL